MTAVLDWRADALCTQMPPDMFFPEEGGFDGQDAKRVCALCPVRNECLTTALENREEYGIFGGLSPGQRGRLMRRVSNANAEKTACERGHEFTKANTHVSPTTGKRNCRACRRMRQMKGRVA